MDSVELIFDGPGVTPATLDARHSLATTLAYIEALVAVAAYDSGMTQPFTVAFEKLKVSSADYVLSCRPARDEQSIVRAWEAAPRRVEAYILDPHHGPPKIRPKVKALLRRARLLPPHVSLRCQMNGWHSPISEIAKRPSPPLSNSFETLRVVIEKAGGREPRVSVHSESDDATFSLVTTKALAEQAGTRLYQLVDIDAEVTRVMRAPDYPVVSGRLIRISEAILVHNAVEAWDAWYAQAGRPWDGVADIEGSLKRHDA